MLLALREDEVNQRYLPLKDRLAERWAAWVLNQPKLFDGLLRLASKLNLTKLIQPFMKVKVPDLAESSFHALWREGEVE
jgi:hypothetical protein